MAGGSQVPRSHARQPIQRGQAALPAARETPVPPCTDKECLKEQGCLMVGRRQRVLVLAILMTDLLPGILELRNFIQLCGVLPAPVAVGWLTFSRVASSWSSIQATGLGLLLATWDYPTRLAHHLLDGRWEVVLLLGLLLRFLEELMADPWSVFLYVIFVRQVFVRLLAFPYVNDYVIPALRWVTPCLRKVFRLSLCPVTTSKASYSQLEDEVNSLQAKIKAAEIQIECLKEAVQAAEGKGSTVCKICYENPVGCALEPCTHHAFCLGCAHKIMERGECPLCKEPVTGLYITRPA